ncbi:flotillin [Sinimarinibacterium sp. CAU 1509]|uniref:flotillin family protein n=1 Tax=Sinimarinibacterium sp. CAU 1509 TaxID=2562283 RepID=UPI0010AC6E2F|nr:flotillin domain-containing protein [Sinimarinibacterium sp. CAU 1509]TJY57328.1 flotillin [Sinimarinibacterium sp. CAU 1509]
MGNLIFAASAVVVGLAILMVLGLALTRLWRRASPERAIVRTGGGKVFVTMEGGCFQIPVIHEITTVNMATMRLDIDRAGERSLITKDRMRVDASVAFFTRVIRSAEGVATAASSLGNRTEDPEAIRQLVESKFDDVIRAVAMSMTLGDLLDKRDEFRQLVLAAVSADLEKNGLELEAVSVTTLNQTDVKYFKADNIFDSEGLTLITRQTEDRRKERNDITQETEVAIAQRNLEASQKKFTIAQTEEQARLEQEEKVANMTAEQAARVQAVRAAREQEARSAEILAQRVVQEAEIESQKVVDIADQQRKIVIAQKSEEQSAAQARADEARAEAVRAQEGVLTATAVAQANRAKQIAVIAAEQSAEQDAVQLRVTAQAERAAAEDRAAAIITEATARADSAELEARGSRAKALAEAEGQRAINDAENSLSPAIISLRQTLAAISELPAILEAQAKPLEKISDFKVVSFAGAGMPGIHGGAAGVAPAAGGVAHQVMDAALQYKLQSPIVDSILKLTGLSDGQGGVNLGALQDLARVGAQDAAVPAPEAEVGASTPAAQAEA